MADSHNKNLNRRTILKTSPVFLTTGLAGCTGGGSDGGSGGSSDGGSGGSSDGGSSDLTTYTLGGAPSGSSMFPASQSMQQVIRNHSDTVRITAQQTPGTTANPRLWADGQVDWFGCSNLILQDIYEETGDFADNPLNKTPLQAFIFTRTSHYILARADSDIETFDDLAGKRVWLSVPGATAFPASKHVFEQLGLLEDIEVISGVPFDGVAGALEEGRIDAILSYHSGSGSILPGWAKQADARVEMKAVTMSDSQKATIQELQSLQYSEVELSSYDQDLGEDSVVGWAIVYPWVMGPEVSREHAKEITMIVNEHGDQLLEASAVWADVTDPEIQSFNVMSDYPVHPGVADAYKELGVWNDEWTEGSL